MSLLKNNQTFRFKNYKGAEPTVKELREEQENIVKFFQDRLERLDKEAEARIKVLETLLP